MTAPSRSERPGGRYIGMCPNEHSYVHRIGAPVGQLEVSQQGAAAGKRHLVGAEGALNLLAVDLDGPGPTSPVSRYPSLGR